MDSIATTEFRKRYAELTAPTIVTSDGRPIGMWIPIAPRMTDERERELRQRWAEAGLAPKPHP